MYVILEGTLTLPGELVPVLFCRAVKATSQVHLVSALPFGFLRLVGMVRSQFLPAGLHGSEGASRSGKNLNAFRSSVVRACWPGKLPMSNPYAVLSLLDAPEGCDLGYFVIWDGVSDKGGGTLGVSYVEILILFAKLIGHRQLTEKTVAVDRRTKEEYFGRMQPLFLTGCTSEFIGSLFRSLALLLGGLTWFILGPHLSRLRHIGWSQCGHGLTCRPPSILHA